MSGAIYMDEVIRPHRSLPRTGFVVLVALMTGFNLGVGVLFTALGAVFVPVFMTLGEFGVLAAFWMSYRAGEQFDRVRVTNGEVRVTRHRRRNVETVWTSPVDCTRVSRPSQDHAPSLHALGRDLRIAEGLSPGRRAEFAEALDEAIRRAQLERRA
jgi:uncharacterized membrane protein